MNVEKLIEELKKYPQDAEVYISSDGYRVSWICEKIEGPENDLDGDITLTGSGFKYHQDQILDLSDKLNILLNSFFKKD